MAWLYFRISLPQQVTPRGQICFISWNLPQWQLVSSCDVLNLMPYVASDFSISSYVENKCVIFFYLLPLSSREDVALRFQHFHRQLGSDAQYLCFIFQILSLYRWVNWIYSGETTAKQLRDTTGINRNLLPEAFIWKRMPLCEWTYKFNNAEL